MFTSFLLNTVFCPDYFCYAVVIRGLLLQKGRKKDHMALMYVHAKHATATMPPPPPPTHTHAWPPPPDFMQSVFFIIMIMIKLA